MIALSNMGLGVKLRTSALLISDQSPGSMSQGRRSLLN